MKRRLFVGIDLPLGTKKRVAKRMRQLAQQMVDVRWERSEKLHLTLKFIGSTSVLPEIITQQLQTKLKETPIFTIEFGSWGILVGKRTTVMIDIVPEEELLKVYHKVQNCLADLGFPKDKRPFHPHITIGRVKNEHVKLPNFTTMSRLPTMTIPVREIVLWESQLKQTGSEYMSLARIPLSKNV